MAFEAAHQTWRRQSRALLTSSAQVQTNRAERCGLYSAMDGTCFTFATSKVTRVSWWMMNYGGRTPKRHYLYSNSPHAAKLQAGKLRNYLRDGSQSPRSQTCKHYINENGKRCWVGTSSLKQTERLAHQHGSAFVD